MSRCKAEYRFVALINGEELNLHPVYDDELSKSIERAQGRNHFTESLSGSLTFVRDEYDLIAGLSIETEVPLTIFVIYPGQSTQEVFFRGKFAKTDCSFDADNRLVTVSLQSNSATKKVLDGLNREYNLVDIAPVTSAVRYTLQPILQVYIAGSSYVNNYVNGTNAEVPVLRPTGSGSPYAETELTDTYKFSITGIGNRVIVPYFDTMPVDVSGTYESDPVLAGLFIRQDGAYRLQRISNRWRIRDESTGTDIYQSDVLPFGEGIFPGQGFEGNDLEKGKPLRPVGIGGPDIFPFRVKIYSRLISPVETLNGVTGELLPDEDIAPSGSAYRYVIPEADVPSIILSSNASTEPTRWGKYADDAVGLSGQYFAEPTEAAPAGSYAKPFPISPTQWKYFSMWFYYPDDLAGSYGNAQVIGINDGYQLHDAINALLQQFAPNVSYGNTAEYSDFFYGSNNPVRGTRKYPVIIPKSNVIIGEYDRAATRAEIRLSDVFEMLLNLYNCDWYVDSENRLRIEHLSFFEAGGTYSGTQVGADFTTLIEPQSSLPWMHRTNKWEYLKEEIPARLEFGYMDKSSRAFEGYPIEVRSAFAQGSNVEERNISKFTCDIDYINSNPNEINPDGFVLIDAELDPAGFRAPFVDITTSAGEAFRLQNGYVSLPYVHENYFLAAMPAALLTINRVEVTANSVRRAKQQELDYASNEAVNPLQLVRTQIGDGLPTNIEVRLSTLNIKITLLHDTE